jgi:hypothetical protein
MKRPVLAGVDISPDTLTVGFERGRREPRLATFKNCPAGHHELERLLRQGRRTARVFYLPRTPSVRIC